MNVICDLETVSGRLNATVSFWQTKCTHYFWQIKCNINTWEGVQLLCQFTDCKKIAERCKKMLTKFGELFKLSEIILYICNEINNKRKKLRLYFDKS